MTSNTTEQLAEAIAAALVRIRDDKPITPAALDYADAASYLGVPERTLRGWVAKQMLPKIKYGGRAKSRVLIRRADLDRFMEASVSPATTGPLANA